MKTKTKWLCGLTALVLFACGSIVYATGGRVLADFLQFSGNSAPAVSPAGKSVWYFDSTSNTTQVSENGGAYGTLSPGNATSANILIGYQAGNSLSGASGNTFIGYRSGHLVTSGSSNIQIGSSTGTLRTGSNNVLIGEGTDTVANNTNGAIAIGRGAIGVAQGFVVGSSTVGVTDVYLGRGVSDTTPANVTIHSTASSANGTNGAGIVFAAGIANQAADSSGALDFQTARTGAGTTSTSRLNIGADGGIKWTGIATANAPATSGAGNGTIYFDSTLNTFMASQNNGAYAALGGATFDNPTAVITGTAINGVATTAMRSDAAPAIGTALTTSDALADVRWGTSATTQKALMLQGKASQTANVFEVQGSNGTVVFAVDVPATTFTGTNATIAGAGAMAAATSADNNTIYGAAAGDGITTGDRNSLFGVDAGGAATFGAASDVTAVGYQAGLVNTGGQNVFVGSSAGAANLSSTRQTFVGMSAGASVTGNQNTIIGHTSGGTLTTGTDNVIIGYATQTSANSNANSVIIGSQASGGNQCTVLGGVAGTTGINDFIAIGYAATPGASNNCVIGSTSSAINNVFFGKGYTNVAATAYTINGTGGSGSDNAGANILLAGGKGTGLANSGYVGQTYPLKTTTGSTLQTMSTLTNWHGGFIYVTTADLTLTGSTATTGTLIGAQTNALPQGTLTLDANLLRIASTVRITATGRITQSASGPTLAIAAKLGATTVATGTIPANAGGIANGAVRVECTLVCRTLGASGTVQGDGTIWVNTTAGTLNDVVTMYQAATTIDTTASQAIDLFGTWSANTAGNAVSIYSVQVEYR